MVSPKRKWRSSERIALEVLESLGFKVIETHKKIKIEGVEVGEVDAIVEDEKGERYAVEIKAGRVDVSGLRQAYVNASLLGVKPLVIAKGYADDSAEVLANKLGIKVILLSDYFLVEAEELEDLVREAINNVLVETINAIVSCPLLSPEDKEFIQKLVSSPTISDLSAKTGYSLNEIVRKIKYLRNKGIIPKHAKTYDSIRYFAAIALAKQLFMELAHLIKAFVKEKCM